MVVPHKTLCYGDLRDPPEEGIPMCTLRNFPNLIEHCIEWSRESFTSLFASRVQDSISFIDNPDAFLLDKKKSTTSAGVCDSLFEVKKFLSLKVNPNFH
jgi:ubiquitin-activating enzyme E1